MVTHLVKPPISSLRCSQPANNPQPKPDESSPYPPILFPTVPFLVLIKIQPDATVCIYLFTAKSLYMFRVSQHPSSGVLKTVTAASGTGTATSLQRGLIRPVQVIRLVQLLPSNVA